METRFRALFWQEQRCQELDINLMVSNTDVDFVKASMSSVNLGNVSRIVLDSLEDFAESKGSPNTVGTSGDARDTLADTLDLLEDTADNLADTVDNLADTLDISRDSEASDPTSVITDSAVID